MRHSKGGSAISDCLAMGVVMDMVALMLTLQYRSFKIAQMQLCFQFEEPFRCWYINN